MRGRAQRWRLLFSESTTLGHAIARDGGSLGEENKPSGPIAITINAAKALGQRFLIFDPRAREEQKAVVSHSPAKNGDVLERVLEHDKDVTMVAGSKCDPPEEDPVRVELMVGNDNSPAIKVRFK